MIKQQEKTGGLRFWFIIWGMGLAGQLCWNMENQWFNTFVYAKIAGNVNIVTWMVIVSALVTTVSTFLFGTLSDRIGKRKRFISIGYIVWGCATIIFGLTEFTVTLVGVGVAGFLVVLTDAIMSFFGSMGCDCGYNVWANDYTNEKNRGQVGAALAVVPIIGTVVGTVVGGALISMGNTTGKHIDDNYQLLFWAMGLFVIAMGLMSLFVMRDHPDVRPHKDGSFANQFFSVFRFSTLKKNPAIKELLLACVMVCTFFIPFNFYFTHMGNWLIYDIGFNAGSMGLVEGIGLLLAALMTIPFAALINRNRLPLVSLVAVLTNALGLVLTFFFVKSPADVDAQNLFCLKNLPVFICVFLIGTGYVLITQTSMIWIRGLFPEESRGQLEGVRVMAFTLIPMFLGTLTGNFIIKNTPQNNPVFDDYGLPIDVPQENLFLIAGIMVLLTLIPLYFAAREHKKRGGA